MLIILIVVVAMFAVLFGGLRLLARAGQRWRDRDEGVDTGETFADVAEWNPLDELDRVHRACVGGLDDLLLKVLHQLLPEPTERDWFHVHTGEYHLVGVA